MCPVVHILLSHFHFLKGLYFFFFLFVYFVIEILMELNFSNKDFSSVNFFDFCPCVLPVLLATHFRSVGKE